MVSAACKPSVVTISPAPPAVTGPTDKDAVGPPSGSGDFKSRAVLSLLGVSAGVLRSSATRADRRAGLYCVCGGNSGTRLPTFTQYAAYDEHDVGGSLAEASHEIRKPLASKRTVHADAIAVSNQR